ncbi:organic cation transporter protein-like [Oppia nitens]|uniref:organic cation transporter protein-like n=1 Tax=Oppia nitens TaxID=1686743 RepID=UPI0023D9B309|nr:organic cation transporter protein-like [Oppia nitens]
MSVKSQKYRTVIDKTGDNGTAILTASTTTTTTTGATGSGGGNTDNDTVVTNVSDIVGPWGRWQLNIFAYFFIGAMCSCWHSLGLSFYAPNISYWCQKPDIYQNISDNEWIERTVGNNNNNNNQDIDYQCQQYGNPSQQCLSWQYDQSFWRSTIISEWDIVCNRAQLASLTQSAYMAGVMVTVVVMGQLSDKYGRRPIIWAGLIIELIAGLSSAFSISIEHFIISRFALAYGASARWGTGFVLLLETVGPEYRAIVGMAIEFGWALGYIVMPGAAYLLRDFRWIQLAVTLPEMVLLLWWTSLPESPRWQLTHGKFTDAESALRRAAEINGHPTHTVETKLKKLMDKALADRDEQDRNNSKSSILDLCRSRAMIKNTLILYFSWFVNALIYYGLSLNTNNLGGNPFINFLLAGAVEFPAYALCIYLLKQYGRRLPQSSAMLGAGISCLLTIPFISNDMVIPRVIFAMIGKFCVTCSFGMIYVYSAEIYPTVVRNVGVGSSSMVGRIGSILAPFVKELGIYTHLTVPFVLFGVISIVDGLMVLLLPETKDRDIPDTIDDVTTAGQSKLTSPSKSYTTNGYTMKVVTNGSDGHTSDDNNINVTSPADGNWLILRGNDCSDQYLYDCTDNNQQAQIIQYCLKCQQDSFVGSYGNDYCPAFISTATGNH